MIREVPEGRGRSGSTFIELAAVGCSGLLGARPELRLAAVKVDKNVPGTSGEV